MTRRIVRTAVQLTLFSVVALCLILFLDNRYRVLPSAIHNHLPAHHPGFVVTDIEITICTSINPFSKCTKDEEYWHRIDKDLYLGKSYLSKAYLHVRRKREEDLEAGEEFVFDIRIGRLAPKVEEQQSKDTRWESRGFGIWLKRSSKRHMSDFANVVTGVDVLFGADAADPRSNWKVQDLALFLDSHGSAAEPRITFRKGPAITLEKPIPRIRKDGKFKIMQAADLHLSTGFGQCRDAIPQGTKCDADPRTLDFVERLIGEEAPDLIILTGDQVNGGSAPDSMTAIYKYSELFARHKIPYAGIFGNHDDEGNLDRAASMAIMDGLPFSLSTAGEEHIDGVGNYVIEVLGRGTLSHSALTIYMLDTHSYSPDEKQYKGYDWIKPNQINWFKETAQSRKKAHAQYTHHHMDLAFIHIPLPEYRNPHNLKWVGNFTEASMAPYYNSGFFDALVEQGVVMVSCGHDHVNDYCLPGLAKDQTPALWMCYGGGSGFGGYGGYGGYIRRMRFFEFDMNEAKITTYKRLEWGDTKTRLDEQVIVDGGRVVYEG